MTETRAIRLAHRVLKWATCLYPPERRVWGEAILAEVHFAEDSGELSWWTFGGLMVALRAFFLNLLSKLFRGAFKHEPGFNPSGGGSPKMPWRLAIACAAISAALLCVPDFRQALATAPLVGKAWWTGNAFPSVETARWEKLGREAESRGDAATMAFVAMRLADRKAGHVEKAVETAKHAVSKDPGLTWTYYFVALPNHDRESRVMSNSYLLQALRQWDPDNALPYIATAEEQVSADAQKLGPPWHEWMDRAFAAPIYDDYSVRRWELERQVMRQQGINDPVSALTAMAQVRLPDFHLLRRYADLRFAEGAEAEHEGHWEQAAAEYRSVAEFSRRMRQRDLKEPTLRDFFANLLEGDSLKRLQPVLPRLGHIQEAQITAATIQERDREDAAFRREWAKTDPFFSSAARWMYVWGLLLGLQPCTL